MTAVADEEYASIGTLAVLRDYRAGAAILTEPTGLAVTVAHGGFVWLDIEVAGVAAHGSRPDLGVDAIAKMGHALVGVEALDRRLRVSAGHPLLGTGSIHASLIEGGTELSTYPDRCLVRIERRTVPGEGPDLVARQIEELIDGIAAHDDAFRATATCGLVRDPFEVSLEEPIADLVRRAASGIVGSERPVTGANWWADSALLSSAGIPTVIFGPDGQGAHAESEWVDLTQSTSAGGSTWRQRVSSVAQRSTGPLRIRPRSRPKDVSAWKFAPNVRQDASGFVGTRLPLKLR